ncbi:MAG: DUF5915 domain-containing protein, partial [Microthrixaceae bacterium]
NISRRRYYGLPLPFYPCTCGHITVIGSKEELAEHAVDSLDELEELRRPWIDDVRIRCTSCGDVVRRVTEVGDVWLDAGIVPFSTLGWHNDSYEPHGYATGAAKGLTGADLPDDAYWQEWFPADWVSEMREQIRLWFYSQLFMSVVLTGGAPYRKVLGYEKMLDETGREMHGSWGNMISAQDAFEQMGADVMRWQYCAQPPSQDLLFGFGPGSEIKRKLLTLWNSASFLVQYANIAEVTPPASDLDGLPADLDGLTSLDLWAIERTKQLVVDTAAGYEAYLTVDVIRAFESYVDDLSNWYIRRARRRFWEGDETAVRVLWWAVVTSLRTISPVMPFLAEHLWQTLVTDALDGEVPTSVFLAEWPAVDAPDTELLADVAAVRGVVELGRQARAKVNLGLRQPLARIIVEGEPRIDGYLGEIANELRVKDVELGEVEATQLKVRPNLKLLGPKLGKDINAVRKALDAGEFSERDDGGFDVAGHTLAADEVLIERTEKEGWAVASHEGVTLALDTELTDALRTESRVLNLIHHVNGMRKDAGMALTDRIELRLAAPDADLLDHEAWIAAEVLAVSIEVGDGDEPTISKT